MELKLQRQLRINAIKNGLGDYVVATYVDISSLCC